MAQFSNVISGKGTNIHKSNEKQVQSMQIVISEKTNEILKLKEENESFRLKLIEQEDQIKTSSLLDQNMHNTDGG